MSLNWLWKENLGWIEEGNNKYVLRKGNAFAIAHYEYEEDGKEYAQLHDFWIDEAHAKNCLGLSKGYNDIYAKDRTWHLKRNEKHNVKIASLVTKAMHTVIWYDEEKGEL